MNYKALLWAFQIWSIAQRLLLLHRERKRVEEKASMRNTRKRLPCERLRSNGVVSTNRREDGAHGKFLESGLP